MSESDNEARVVAERLQIMAQGYLDMTDRAEKAERLLDEARREAEHFRSMYYGSDEIPLPWEEGDRDG